MRKACLFLITLSLFLTSCNYISLLKNVQNPESAYQESIVYAMSPEASKVSDALIEIKPENSNLVWKEIYGENYLLVVSYKSNTSYYEAYMDSSFYPTGNYEMWITTAPELHARMQELAATDVDQRLNQLLGLPPGSKYGHFVEFWVKPSDLFRPCPDKEIDDSSCELCFPDDVDQAHKEWINANRISRYYECALDDKYPWTQLGYTYDWNPANRTHVGLSEFVIGKNKQIIVKAIYTTEEYLSKPNPRE